MSDDLAFTFDVDADEALAAKAAEAAKRVRAELCALMGTPGNRARIWDWLERSGQTRTVARCDALQMMQLAAVRDFGLGLRNELHEACPDLLTLAEREANDRAN